MPVTDDDKTLLHRTVTGDTAAFDVIVERHEPAVHRFVQALGGDDLDDVLQETFIAAWKSAATYEGKGTVRSWLLSIARNIHRHSLRRRVDAPRVLEPLDVIAERAGWGRDPAEARRVEAALARDVLERAMSTLSPEAREILVLRELEGLSGEESAAMLQITLPAVKSRLHRARLQLAAAVRHQDQSHSMLGGNRVTV